MGRAERVAAEEKRKRELAAKAAKRGPSIQPKMGKFVADRAQADEQVRVVGLFKEFSDRGKVPEKMIPLLIKELFKGAGEPPLVARLSKEAKEALGAKAGGDGRLEAKAFTSWYFEVAWPSIVDSRKEAKRAAEEAKALEAKAAAEAAAEQRERERLEAEAAEAARREAEAAREQADREAAEVEAAARAAEEQRAAEAAASLEANDETRPSQPGSVRSQAGAGGYGGAVAAGLSGNLVVEPGEMEVDLPPEPVGWSAARGIDVAEMRRLVAILGRQAVLTKQERPGGESVVSDLLIPSKAARALLAEALAPHEDAPLLSKAPRGGSHGVPMGSLVHFWFERVWPKWAAEITAPASADPPVDIE